MLFERPHLHISLVVLVLATSACGLLPQYATIKSFHNTTKRGTEMCTVVWYYKPEDLLSGRKVSWLGVQLVACRFQLPACSFQISDLSLQLADFSLPPAACSLHVSRVNEIHKCPVYLAIIYTLRLILSCGCGGPYLQHIAAKQCWVSTI